MENLEVDIIKKVAVCLCFVRRRDGIDIPDGNKSEQGIGLPRRNGIEIVLVHIQFRSARTAFAFASGRFFGVRAVRVPRIGTAFRP